MDKGNAVRVAMSSAPPPYEESVNQPMLSTHQSKWSPQPPAIAPQSMQQINNAAAPYHTIDKVR